MKITLRDHINGYYTCILHAAFKYVMKQDFIERTQIPGSKCYECMQCSLSLKDTSLIRTERISRRGVLNRGGPLYGLYFASGIRPNPI